MIESKMRSGGKGNRTPDFFLAREALYRTELYPQNPYPVVIIPQDLDLVNEKIILVFK